MTYSGCPLFPCELLLSIASLGADLPAAWVMPPPPGHHARSSTQLPVRFAEGEPLIATTYFYWYDAPTKLHLIDPDGSDALTDHPPTLDNFSFKSTAWHKSQLIDMSDAGIDVVLAVYWGEPTGGHNWSDEGLPVLVAAREQLLAEGGRPPAIAMFYDTTTLQSNAGRFHVDLRTPQGMQWFFGTIRNFYSQIPPAHRASVDGRLLVFLYGHDFANGIGEPLFVTVRQLFEKEFGCGLFLVKTPGWPGRADAVYAWGGAIRPQFLDVASFGPGYDHSAVPGREPLVRLREDGRFYERAWRRLLAMSVDRRPWLVHLETWNEFHEGTEICRTREYGSKYLDLTRAHAAVFHERKTLPPLPSPDIVSADPHKSNGVQVAPKPSGDGPIVEQQLARKKAWSTIKNHVTPNQRYMYFDVEDDFLADGDATIEVTVAYWDFGPAAWELEYDSCDPRLSGTAQAFRKGHRQMIRNTAAWQSATFTIPHARFAGRSNGSDLRLSAVGADFSIGCIILRRIR